MREIVVHRDAAGRADDFKPPLHAGKRFQAVANLLDADAGVGRHRHRRQRVAYVVLAGQRHLEGTERRPAASDMESGDALGGLDVVRLPVRGRPRPRSTGCFFPDGAPAADALARPSPGRRFLPGSPAT